MIITVYLKPDGSATFNPTGIHHPSARVYIECVHGLIDKEREPTYDRKFDTIALYTTLNGSPHVIWEATPLYKAAKDGNFGFRISE